MSLLRIKNLNIAFKTDEGSLQAVKDVSFDIEAGEILGLVGESGCGKSVSAMSILRLLPLPAAQIQSGEIIYKEKNLLDIPLKELRNIRGNEIGVIFQEPMTALSPLKKVGSQMIEILRFHHQLSKSEAEDKARYWLQQVGIPDPVKRLNNYPFEYSGGMRQRAMIAMVMMLQPNLIIADEPTTALDVTIQAQIFEEMLKLKGEDKSMLFITHDMGVIWEMCDRVVVMYASEVVEIAKVKEPLHPYTQGLLKAVPAVHKAKEKLTTIEGQLPSPLNYPAGCHFANRCPLADEKCRQQKPPLDEHEPGHQVRCFKAGESI